MKDDAMSGETPRPGKVRPIDRAREMLRESGVAEGLDEVKERVNEVAEEAERRYEKVADEVKEGAGRARDAARERFDHTADTMRRGYHKARVDFGGALGDLTEFVRESPTRAIAIAAGIGFALGLILRPRGTDDDDE